MYIHLVHPHVKMKPHKQSLFPVCLLQPGKYTLIKRSRHANYTSLPSLPQEVSIGKITEAMTYTDPRNHWL